MTRLGNAAACAKQGRYGRVMGDHWRNKEREKLTFAANGLLLDIWSYCADQATDELAVDAMRKLTSADRKHAGRMVQQLVDAGHLAPTTTGWHVPGWKTLNPIARVPQLRVVAPHARQAEVPAEVSVEVLAQGNAPPEIIQETCVPRARAETQDPRIKRDSPAESPAASAGAPPESPPEPAPKPKPKPPKKARESDAHRPALKPLVAEEYAKAFEARHGVAPGGPNWALVQCIVNWAGKLADPEAAVRKSCAGYFASWVGENSSHPLHLWAKNPAGFYAEAKNGQPRRDGRPQERWRELAAQAHKPSEQKKRSLSADEAIELLKSYTAAPREAAS